MHLEWLLGIDERRRTMMEMDRQQNDRAYEGEEEEGGAGMDRKGPSLRNQAVVSKYKVGSLDAGEAGVRLVASSDDGLDCVVVPIHGYSALA
jgi:hypothetical protein